MASINPMVEAAYYTREEGYYKCDLCPHRCHIRPGSYGKCGSRYGEDDMLVAYTYGRLSSICVDPIEKKPLYHFYPGAKTFSVGSVGCNMSCRHCQNYAISQYSTGKKRTTYVSPEKLIGMCRNEKLDIISFTYNEPTIWYEYIMDVMDLDPDLTCVLVTNGLANEKPMKDLCKVTSAMNIDVKGFTDDFYMKVCGAHLEDVLRSVKLVFDQKVHVELTYLMIPGLNDSMSEIREFAVWVRNNLSEDVPVHFTRFHPDNEMNDVQWTSPETLIAARDTAISAGLNYVYIGNILAEGTSDTYCPECGTAVVKRLGYLVDIEALDGRRCACCKHRLNMVR
ncbi:MAG: AmmeMemoRadiSam system radical SAM enzyme [Candidatus Methanomethylophilaceae archaeon]